jgi:DNA-binding NtrC family response regulator
VLLAEDDSDFRTLITIVLERDGHEVHAVSDGDALRRQIAVDGHCPWDAVVSDVCMPGKTGLDVLFALQDEEKAPPIILMSAFANALVHEQAERWGAFAMFEKPFDIDDLRTAVLSALSCRRRRE